MTARSSSLGQRVNSALGRTVTALLFERGLPVHAIVRREVDRAAASQADGAVVVVVGDRLELADFDQVVSGYRRV